ncbi:MAG: FAD-dependent oxidoreductase [Hyphomicrobiales bacterium]|jgi:3-phenylpropionate/trans-cinnamate dioxygenase ferredoxin reductase subunit
MSDTSSSARARTHADVLIIGAGQAGFQVAVSLRQKRFEGTILMVGDEPYPPYHRPPLSKAALKDGLNEATLWYRPDAFYETQMIEERRSARAESLDRDAKQVTLSDGSLVGYDKLVLATGARARSLPQVMGVPEDTIFTLRTLDDAHALQPKLKPGVHVAVVGAGYIGLEVAASARQLGCEVAVVDQAARAMQRTASPTISAHFQNLHVGHGVRFQLADTVTGLTDSADFRALVCGSGAELPFDIVVAGIGVIPNDDLARQAGLLVEDGIVADTQGRTSDASIFAAGDCARHAHTGFSENVRFESVQSAIDQGKVVAAAILGADDTHSAVPWFWSDQYDAKLQVVGIPTGDCAPFIKGDPASGSFAVYHMIGNEPVAVEAVNAPHDFVIARKTVGTDRPLDAETLDALVPISS